MQSARCIARGLFHVEKLKMQNCPTGDKYYRSSFRPEGDPKKTLGRPVKISAPRNQAFAPEASTSCAYPSLVLFHEFHPPPHWKAVASVLTSPGPLHRSSTGRPAVKSMALRAVELRRLLLPLIGVGEAALPPLAWRGRPSSTSATAGDELAGKSAYEVLGVGEASSSAEIKASFHRLAKETHPDVSAAAGSRRFLQILAAYEVPS